MPPSAPGEERCSESRSASTGIGGKGLTLFFHKTEKPVRAGKIKKREGEGRF